MTKQEYISSLYNKENCVAYKYISNSHYFPRDGYSADLHVFVFTYPSSTFSQTNIINQLSNYGIKYYENKTYHYFDTSDSYKYFEYNFNCQNIELKNGYKGTLSSTWIYDVFDEISPSLYSAFGNSIWKYSCEGFIALTPPNDIYYQRDASGTIRKTVDNNCWKWAFYPFIFYDQGWEPYNENIVYKQSEFYGNEFADTYEDCENYNYRDISVYPLKGYIVILGDKEIDDLIQEQEEEARAQAEAEAKAKAEQEAIAEAEANMDEEEHARNALAYLFHISFHNALAKRYYHFGEKQYIDVPKIMDNYDQTGHLPYVDGKVGINKWSNEDLNNFIDYYPDESPDFSQSGHNHSGFIDDVVELYNRIGFAFSKNGTVDTITYQTKEGNVTESSVAYLTNTGKIYLQIYVKDLHLEGDDVGKAWRAAYYDYQDYLPKWPMGAHEQETTWYEMDWPIYDDDGNFIRTEQKRFCEHLYVSFYNEERRQEMLQNMEKFFLDMGKTVQKVTGVPTPPSGANVGKFFDKSSSTTAEQKVKIAKCIHDYLILHNEYCLDSEYSQSLYGAMGGWEYEGKGPVCTSYAFAFKYCCNRYGIICHLAFGDASDQHNGDGLHMWNRINYDDPTVSDIVWLYWGDDLERLEYFACKEDSEHFDRYKDDSGQSYYTDGDPSQRDWYERYGSQAKLPWTNSAQQFRKQSWYEVDVTWDDQGGDNVIWERFNLSTQEMGARLYSENGKTNTGLECYYNYIGQDYYGGQDLSGALEDRHYYGCNIYYW